MGCMKKYNIPSLVLHFSILGSCCSNSWHGFEFCAGWRYFRARKLLVSLELIARNILEFFFNRIYLYQVQCTCCTNYKCKVAGGHYIKKTHIYEAISVLLRTTFVLALVDLELLRRQVFTSFCVTVSKTFYLPISINLFSTNSISFWNFHQIAATCNNLTNVQLEILHQQVNRSMQSVGVTRQYHRSLCHLLALQ